MLPYETWPARTQPEPGRTPGRPDRPRIDPGGAPSQPESPSDCSTTPIEPSSTDFSRPKSAEEGPEERFSSILGRFGEDFRGFSSRLARFFANMLTLSKHRVGRVQIALRRGADVGNFAKIDEHSCFFSAKRCERTRTTKKHRKLPPKSPPGCPRGAPGRPRAAPGPRSPGCPGDAPGASSSRQDRPKSAPGAPRPPRSDFWLILAHPSETFFENNVFAWRVCVTGRSLTHTLHAKTWFLQKSCGRVCQNRPQDRF